MYVSSVRLDMVRPVQFATTYNFLIHCQCSAISGDKRILCAVGDSTDSILADAQSGEGTILCFSYLCLTFAYYRRAHTVTMPVIKVLHGHIDYSFACCWSPDGRYLATGNQDKTTRIYDIRNLSETLHVLRANLGAIRSLHFSNDGCYLAAAGMTCEI
jgi:WD40 repeat protein